MWLRLSIKSNQKWLICLKPLPYVCRLLKSRPMRQKSELSRWREKFGKRMTNWTNCTVWSTACRKMWPSWSKKGHSSRPWSANFNSSFSRCSGPRLITSLSCSSWREICKRARSPSRTATRSRPRWLSCSLIAKSSWISSVFLSKRWKVKLNAVTRSSRR